MIEGLGSDQKARASGARQPRPGPPVHVHATAAAFDLAEHKEIVGALRKRDPDAAFRAMEGHLDAVMTELVDFAERNPDAVALPARDPAAA